MGYPKFSKLIKKIVKPGVGSVIAAIILFALFYMRAFFRLVFKGLGKFGDFVFRVVLTGLFLATVPVCIFLAYITRATEYKSSFSFRDLVLSEPEKSLKRMF